MSTFERLFRDERIQLALRRSLTLTLLSGFGPPRGSYSKRALQFLATLMHDKLAI